MKKPNKKLYIIELSKINKQIFFLLLKRLAFHLILSSGSTIYYMLIEAISIKQTMDGAVHSKQMLRLLVFA